mgnify:FL=1
MKPLIGDVVVKLSVLALILAGLAWGWWRRRGLRDERGRLPAIWEAKNPGKPIASAARFEKVIDGTTFQCESHSGDEDIPSYLVVTILETLNGDFAVTQVPAGSEPGWLKRHGITHVLSGDASFDKRFDVVTDRTPAFVKECMQMPEAREAVRTIFAAGETASAEVTLIRNDGRGIDAIYGQLSPDVDIDALLETAAVALNELLRCCDNADRATHRSLIPERWRWPGALVVPAAVFLSGIAAVAWHFWTPGGALVHATEGTWSLDFLIAGVLLLAVMAVCSYVVKGRSNSVKALILLSISSLAGLFFASSMWVLAGNKTFDRSPPTLHVQKVIGFQAKDFGFEFEVESWHPEKNVQNIFIPEKEFLENAAAFISCEEMAIETKPGFFGYEWISSRKPLPIDHPERN